MARLAASIALTLLLLAGCMDADAPAPSGPVTSPNEGSASNPAANATSGVESGWQVGQWWRWRLSSVAFDDVEVTTVVTKASLDAYQVGVPAKERAAWALAYHTVALGTIDRPNNAWVAHGMPVEIVDRPVTDGKTWTRDFWFGAGITLTATAESTTRFQIVGKNPEGGTTWAGTWDEEAGVFVSLSQHFGASTAFSTATLLESGEAYNGEVFDLAFTDLYRTGGGLDTTDPAANFAVPTGVTYMFAACWLGGDTGHYEVAFIPPSGTASRCQQENIPTPAGTRLHMLTWEPTVETGGWRVERVVGGHGTISTEVLRVDFASP